MIIDGRAIAEEILEQTKESVARLGHPPIVRYYSPTVSPATASYLKIKEQSARRAGCVFEETTTPISFSDEEVDAGIVQLPLPAELEPRRTAILNSIPLEKDADVLSDTARAHFEANESGALLPPVVDAVREILARAEVSIQNKKAVVVGKGWLVGAPVATWLSNQGAEVTVVEKADGLEALKEADIIVSGAGSPGLIKPEHLKPGVVLIDAGTSESGGAIVGDADPACAEVASVFTPVPGGVGPIAVACLFRNAGILAQKGTLHPGT